MEEVKLSIYRVNNVPRDLSVRLFLRTVFHIACTCLFWSVAVYGGWMGLTVDEKLLIEPVIRNSKDFVACFLTNWNFLFQTVFLSLSLIYDVLEWLDKHESNVAVKIRYLRDVIFSGLVVPMTLFISTMFWTIYLIDRELVFPVVVDQVVPWWFNHCVHTNIVIVLLLETILQARRHPADFKVEITLDIICSVLYAVVYYTIYFFTGHWLYAVFGVMNWWQVCIFQLLIWAACLAFYFIQFPINRIFHRKGNVDDILIDKEDEKITENGKEKYQNSVKKLQKKVEDGHHGVEKYQSEVQKRQNGVNMLQDGKEKKYNGVRNIPDGLNKMINGIEKVANEVEKSINGVQYIQNDLGKAVGKNEVSKGVRNANEAQEMANRREKIINDLEKLTNGIGRNDEEMKVNSVAKSEETSENKNEIELDDEDRILYNLGNNENDEDSISEDAFDASWSQKYRTIRNQFENSSM